MTERYDTAVAEGSAAYRAKDYAGARAALSRALEIRPSHAALVFLHAQACLKDGDKEAAREGLARILRLDPGNRKARNLFRLLIAGRADEADRALLREVDAMQSAMDRPGFLTRLLSGLRPSKGDRAGLPGAQRDRLARARTALDRGDHHAALAVLQPLSAECPGDRSVLLALADARLALGQVGTLIALLEDAAAQSPSDLALTTRLIRAAAQDERPAQAEALLAGLSKEARETPEGLLARATMAYHAEDWPAALDLLDRLDASGDPGPEGVALRALILAETGRFEEAAPHFDEWARRAPLAPRLYMRASATRVLRKGTSLFEQAREITRDASAAQATRATAHFALTRAWKAAGDREAEWEVLVTANRLMDRAYDAEAEAAQIDRLCALPAPPAPAPDEADRGKGMVFVCGLPRSGTTLAAQIIAAHPEAVSIGESALFHRCLAAAEGMGYPDRFADLTAAQLAELGQIYLDGLPAFAREARVVVDKDLPKYQHLGLLSGMLPGARVLLTRRDPMDACYSMFGQVFPGWPSAIYRQETLADLVALHDRVTAHWDRTLPRRPHVVQYERLVEDLETETRRLLEAAGLEFHPDCLNFHEADTSVKTASAYQVRQKVHGGAVGAWRRHAEGLEPLRAALEARGVALDAPG